MACDLCGSSKKPTSEINERWRTAECGQICADCEQDANKQIQKVRRWTESLMEKLVKRWMKNRKDELHVAD